VSVFGSVSCPYWDACDARLGRLSCIVSTAALANGYNGTPDNGFVFGPIAFGNEGKVPGSRLKCFN